MIATLPPRTKAPEQRMRLSCVPWDAYVTFCDQLAERHMRVTYDHGEMEVMSLSPKHERKKTRLARFVEMLTLELDMEIEEFGSMTCRREDLECGLEPDECYWIDPNFAIADPDELDLESDPPPNLALEIEISRSSMNRMSIYAALKVAEVWRWDGKTLTIHLLGARGTYRVSKRSRAFPFLPMDEFVSFRSEERRV